MLQRKVFLEMWKGTVLTSTITGGFIQHWNVKEVNGKDQQFLGFVDGMCIGFLVGVSSPVILLGVPCYIGYKYIK